MPNQPLRIQENAPALRPAARVVDTYHRPNAPAVGPAPVDQKSELAMALSGVNEALTKFAIPWAIGNEMKGSEDKAKALLVGLTPEEALAKMKDGTLAPNENEYVIQHINANIGQRFAEQRQNDLGVRLHGESTSGDPSNPNHFDRSNPNVSAEQWARGQMVQDLQGLQGKEAQAAYTRTMEQWMPHFNAAESKIKADQFDVVAGNTVYGDLIRTANLAGQGANGGPIDATKVHQDLKGVLKRAGELYGVLTPEKQSGIMLKAAHTLAEQGQFGLVDAIMNGEDGIAAAAGPDAPKLLDHARKKMLEGVREKNIDARVRLHDAANQGILNEPEAMALQQQGLLTSHEVEGYITHSRQMARANLEAAAAAQQKTAQEMAYQQQETQVAEHLQKVGDAGGLLFIRPLPVKTKTGAAAEYGVDDLTKRGVDNFIDEVLPRRAAAYAEREGLAPNSPQVAEWSFNHRLEFFSKNGVKDPQWEALLKGGASVANSPNITADNIPPALTTGYQLFKQLNAKSPHTLGQHLTDRDAGDFYEAARIGEQRFGMGEREALLWASDVQKGVAKQDPELFKVRLEDLRTNIDKLKTNGLFDKLFGDKVVNSNVMAPDFERATKLYVKLGLNSDEAIKTAAERFKGQFVNINGWLVDGSDGRIRSFPSSVAGSHPNAAPVDFDTAFKGYLGEWAAKHGEVDASDIGVVQVNPGVFLLVGGKGLRKGMPLIEFGSDKGINPMVTLDEIRQAEVHRQLASRAKVDAQVQQDQATRYDPWFTSQGLSVGPFSPSGFSPEETAIIDQKRQEQLKGDGMTRREVDAAGRFGGRKH